MTCREATLSDIPSMARVWMDGGGGEGGTSADRMERYLKGEHHPQHALKPRVIYIALDGDSLVGYIAGHLTRRYGCDGELQWIYVAPEHRAHGVAAELLRRLAEWFAQRNAARVCVNVDLANTTARRFYLRHGAESLNEHWLVWNDIRAGVAGP